MSALVLAASDALFTARLNGLLAWLDTGAGTVVLEVCGGDWPGAGISGGTLLASASMGKPCGTVADGVLALAATDATGALVIATGEARWARCKTAAGAWAFDCGVGAEGGAGALTFKGAPAGPNGGVLLYAGGKLPPVSLRIAG